MGADLYINKLSGKAGAYEVSYKAIKNGYFRDCYNDGGLFNFIRSNTVYDPSWWQMARDTEWFKKDGYTMTVRGATEMLAEVREWQRMTNQMKQFVLKMYEADPQKLNPAEITYYKKWLGWLIEFLEIAIKMRSTISWSV
jgi:hypothetical protein